MKPRTKKVNSKVETKTTKAATKAASAEVAAPSATKSEAAAPTPAPRPSKIKILKPETKYRGAREQWFARLREFEGKTEGEFLANTKEKPPSLTKNGTPEPPSGWVRFFVRTGVLSLQQ